jgi:hypothetical protein
VGIQLNILLQRLDYLFSYLCFWRSAKCERIYLNEYQSISDLITDMDDYIEFYNHQRFHETLKYKKPMDGIHGIGYPV